MQVSLVKLGSRLEDFDSRCEVLNARFEVENCRIESVLARLEAFDSFQSALGSQRALAVLGSSTLYPLSKSAV